MPVVQQFTNSTDFWSEMVVPDCNEYRADRANLRRALHSAISLFHMHDWVFHTHEAAVRANFSYIDKAGARQQVSTPEEFANALAVERQQVVPGQIETTDWCF